MKILFYGDSITDAGRNRDPKYSGKSLGDGYVTQIAGRLYEKSLIDYEVLNYGISGNRIVDLYARVKTDLWNEKPDLISILIGVNDVWHEIAFNNGVDIERFEKMYRILIEDTIKVLPDVKIIICEPFVTHGFATNAEYERFLDTKNYAKVAKKIADEFGLYFVPLQRAFDEAYEKYGEDFVLSDGVHPNIKGSVILANEWLKVFEKIEKDVKK